MGTKVVLILIILEVTLWVKPTTSFVHVITVLILIILEVTLWVLRKDESSNRIIVLILIILEVTLWVLVCFLYCSRRLGLNPYYTGSYSMRSVTHRIVRNDYVLILIILEVTLWGCLSVLILKITTVLILIILEVTLWV